MAYTTPQFTIEFTVNGHVTITFTDASTTVCNVTGARRYNSRTFSPSVDAAAYVATAMSSADSGGTWTASEVAGDFRGKVELTRSLITDGKTVSLITFSAGLTGKMFGYDSNAPTATANVVTGTWMRQYLWIPHPTSRTFMTKYEAIPSDSTVVTTSPGGLSTFDSYGRFTEWEIEIETIPAAAIYQHYADDSDYAGQIGATTGDLNCSLDSFRRAFIDSEETQMRFHKDLTVPSTYTTMNAYDMSAFLVTLGDALTISSMAPYEFDVVINLAEA